MTSAPTDQAPGPEAGNEHGAGPRHAADPGYEPDPVREADAVPAAGAGDDEPPVRRTRARHRRWILVTVLTLLLLASVAGGVYLWQVATAQDERITEWEVAARELGDQVAELTAELDDLHAELDVARGQLATAHERLNELADEKAQLRDENVVVGQAVDYQERVSQAAGRVATALDTCIGGQEQLIELLADEAEYDPEQLSEFAENVEAVCQAARDANESLQQELEP